MHRDGRQRWYIDDPGKGSYNISQSRQVKQSFLAPKAAEVDTILFADAPENRYDYTLPFFSTFKFSAKLRAPFWVRKEKKERKDASNVFQIFFQRIFFSLLPRTTICCFLSHSKKLIASQLSRTDPQSWTILWITKQFFPNNKVYN